MIKKEYIVRNELAPYVNCIMVGSSSAENSITNIPLYADGYPGIMFQQSKNGFYLLPKNKKLSELFLYGQTLEPIALDVKGPHKYLVIQLYPFASKHLLGIDPKVLNDDCYDLLQIKYLEIEKYRTRLSQEENTEKQVEIISELILHLIAINKVPVNDKIQQSISLILENNGQVTIREILDRIHMTERTFERNFKAHIGLTPKQFAKIVQFQSSIDKLTNSKYNSLLDIGLDSGFSDQSHFIREFKKYTSQTPSFYLNQLGLR